MVNAFLLADGSAILDAMQAEIEFLYHIEIRKPAAAKRGGHLAPIRRLAFGRAPVELDEFPASGLPVAYRLRRPGSGHLQTFRTDGTETLGRFLDVRVDELRGWFRSLSTRHTLDAIALRRWFGDGKAWRGESWIDELKFVSPNDGSLVSDDREAALTRALAQAAKIALVGREVWMRRGFGVLTVLTPGSAIDPAFPAKLTKVPRLEFGAYRPADAASAWRFAEFAARDLLFYPDEEVQARARAAEFGGRLAADWEVEEAPDLSCYPDLSTLSMTAWAQLLKRQAAAGFAPAVSSSVVPHEFSPGAAPPLPEVGRAVGAFLAEAASGKPSRELLPAFSSLSAVLGSTLNAARLAQRSDVVELIDMHGRIVRRVEARPDRRAAARLAQDDETALGAIADEAPGPRM